MFAKSLDFRPEFVQGLSPLAGAIGELGAYSESDTGGGLKFEALLDGTLQEFSFSLIEKARIDNEH